MRLIRDSVGNKLLAVSAVGTTLFAGAAGYGLWGGWEALRGLQDAAAARAGTRAIIVSLVLMAAASGLAFATFYAVMRRAIARPAASLVADLARLAGGDFATPIKHRGTDEFGEIAASAEKIRVDLGRIVQAVQSSAHQLAAEAEKVARSSSASTRYSQEQSGSAATIAANVEQVTVSINSIAENTEEVRRQAVASLDQAQKGNEKLSELVGQIDVAESAMREIETAVSEFLQSTRSIITMTQQVRDIADQTNLLALNAAIEAARAGEQGRGFAVVADEVRKLAEKSAQSASQIDDVTHALSQKSESVDRAIKQGQQSLQSSQDSVEEVAVVLSESNHLIAEATHGVEAISASVKEQNVATHDIARNIETIAQKAEESCRIVQETAQAVESLHSLSEQLQQTANRFRV
jgi:methyl-accepting chemotaxis protein